MFEKEAEEWVKENMDCCKTDNSVNQSIPYFDEEERCCAKSAFQDGAEFGYNKANEWHDLRKNPKDLPNKELEEKQLLVRVRNYTEDYSFAYYMLDKYCSNNGKGFYSDIDCDYPMDIEDIIAWKEIVFPKEGE